MNGQPLPDFIKSFHFKLAGKALRAFTDIEGSGLQYIAFDADEHPRTGLFFDLESEVAEWRCGQALIRYEDGHATCFTPWDAEQPEASPAAPFREWVREKVKEDIERLLSWHLERLSRTHPIADHEGVYRAFCSDCAGVPDHAFRDGSDRAPLFEMLGAVHRINQVGGDLDGEETSFARFNAARTSGNDGYTKELHDMGIRIALSLLPLVPEALKVGIAREIEDRFAPFEKDPATFKPEQFMRLAQEHASSPAYVREEGNDRLMALCTDPTRAHIVFSMLTAFPDEARCYLDIGLAMATENVSLLVAAESFYHQHGPAIRLHDVQKRLARTGVKPASPDNVQTWIDRYTYLTNDFCHFRPKTDTDVTGPELAELEERLNRYWLDRLPSENAPSCPALEQELISQNRFLSAGSAGYVGGLRIQGRHDEVVDHMMGLAGETRLSAFRYRTSPARFESYLNNGIGSLLDSQEDVHIQKALLIMDTLESVIPAWEDGGALYNLACVAARAGQLERAMNYVRTMVARGKEITGMVADPDLTNLREHPDFVALTRG